MVKGEGHVYPRKGQSFDPTRIPKLISDAGFTAAEVLVTIDGSVTRGREFFELHASGLNQPFVLSGGPQAGALHERKDIVGKKIRMTGKLHPRHGDGPPGLTVEEFEVQP